MTRLDAAVKQQFDLSWSQSRERIESGKVWVDGQAQRDPAFSVSSESKIELRMNAPRNPKPALAASAPTVGRDRIVFLDSQLVVVDKPPGIVSVPHEGESEVGTLIAAVAALLGQRRLEVVHRIDKETSGLMVFARTRDAARGLAQQFRFHTIERRYLAIAHGEVGPRTIRSVLIKDRGDGLGGSAPKNWRVASGEGKDAVTHVRTIEKLKGATLVECRLETGRTHQIRIHLSEAGHPLVGEKLYVRNYAGERIEAPRVMLHAAELGLQHPSSGASMRWKREAPEDFTSVLTQLLWR